jgi:flavin-dependent dehydrogenase
MQREAMQFDVPIAGGGPAGLGAAIRLKQPSAGTSVCVVGKGAEIGGHILRGAAIDLGGLDEPVPDRKPIFPGGASVGGDAGFPKASRIEGSNAAIASGMLAAEDVAGSLSA